MATNESTYTITLGGDDAPLRAIVNSFKSSFKSAAADIEATANKINLFSNVEQNVKDASAAFFKATDAAASFRQQIAQIQGVGGTVGKELTVALAATEKQVASTSKEFNKQSTQLDKLRASLTSAGVDTKNLVAEQARLSTELQKQHKVDADRNAAAVLGIKLTKDQVAGVQQLYAAYNTLRANGLASSKDLAAAQKALNDGVKATTAGVKEGATAAQQFGAALKTGLTNAVLPFVGIAAAIGIITNGFLAAIDAGHEFTQAIAEIGAVTNLSNDQLAKLGDGVRGVASTLGLDLNSGLKATEELLRSGVSEGNVIDVLRVSAEAAKAAVVDVGVGVKAANLLLDSFGATVDDLPILFDKITRGAHDGGASLTDFANSAGPLLNVARATGQSFDSVLAVLTVLVDKSGDASKSFTDLTKILTNIGTTEARNNLRALGITTTDVAQIFEQLGTQGKTLEDVLGLGLAAGGAKSAAALANLTNNAKELPEELDRIAGSAGATADALKRLYDTPTERAARLNASLHETALNFGLTLGSGSNLADVANDLVISFNDIVFASRPLSTATKDVNTDVAELVAGFTGLPIPTGAAGAALGGFAENMRLAAQQSALTSTLINQAKEDLKAFGADLVTDIKASQDALTRDIADIQTRADAQVAALDRSRAAEAKTAADTLAIQLQAAKAKLAAIQASEKAITDATNAALAARASATKAAGETVQKTEAASNAIRLQAIGQTLGAYQQLYSQLVTLAQGALARVQGFEEARVSVAQKVEDEIRGIRFDALTGLDQYVARMAEIDRLVSEGRKKAAEGDTAAAKQFFDQAIDASKGLAKTVDESGREVISSTQAQSDKITALKKIQDASNQAFGDQAAAAKKGADGAIDEANRIAVTIGDLQKQYDGLKATVADGLKLKVETDEASVNAALATLDDLSKDRHVKLIVDTVSPDGSPAPTPTGFRSGGFVRGLRTTAAVLNRGGEVVRQFARGGPVFRTPNWMKVPGQGSGDTVPARLQAGSFVVRKAASSYYGDGIMGALARGFAGGGTVSQADIRKYAEQAFAFDPTKPVAPGSQAPLTKKGGTNQDYTTPPISFDTRPIPTELITAMNVIAYAKEMLNAVGQTNPMLGVLLPTILTGIKAVESNPRDGTALTKLLQAAETIGSNPYVFDMYGLTASHASARKPEWFIDWLELRGLLGSGGGTGGGSGGSSVSIDASSIAKRFFQLAITQIGAPPRSPLAGGRTFPNPLHGLLGFNAGGGSTDTVPAMLTPGEFVINKAAASRYGGGLLNAINSMAVPRDFLANMMRPPMPISRFQDGGSVGSAGGATTFNERPGNVGQTNNFNFNAGAAEILTERNILNFIVPVLLQNQRRNQ